MVRTILKGGLGNQMFQYSVGKSLALKYDTQLFLDISFLKLRIPFKNVTPLRDFTYRDYALDIFGIEDIVGTAFNNDALDKFVSYPLTHYYHKVFDRNYFQEGADPYLFRPEILERGPNTTIEGFWNNHKYFKKFEKVIKDIFNPDKLIDDKFNKFEQEIKNKTNPVAIHIRRGDYLRKKQSSTYVTLEKYYKKAIDYMRKRVESPFFYIFSQTDHTWIRSYLGLDKDEFMVVDNSLSGYKNRSHFRFMTLCEHNIISNSTFSWWAAYLNEHKDKVVITPRRWMHKYEFDHIKSWVILE